MKNFVNSLVLTAAILFVSGLANAGTVDVGSGSVGGGKVSDAIRWFGPEVASKFLIENTPSYRDGFENGFKRHSARIQIFFGEKYPEAYQNAVVDCEVSDTFAVELASQLVKQLANGGDMVEMFGPSQGSLCSPDNIRLLSFKAASTLN